MSDLQTDIETVDNGFGCNHTTHRQYTALESVVEAARLVAEPNIEAGVKAYIDKWDELSPYANTRACFEAGLAAALTRGDTDDYPGQHEGPST